MDKPIMIRISSEVERIQTASVLIKNGYTVRQIKKRKASGTGYDYWLEVTDND